MSKRFEQTLHQRRCTDSKQAPARCSAPSVTQGDADGDRAPPARALQTAEREPCARVARTPSTCSSHALLVGVQNGTSTSENSFAVS